jgi:aldose 1-epimerase
MQRIQKSSFLSLANGSDVSLYTLTNADGMSVGILDLGGIIFSLRTPDRFGNLDEVVLAYQDPTLYLTNPMYFGGLIGRVANRIQGASFTLDDKKHTLVKNNGSNNLHSGPNGFETRLWQASTLLSSDSANLTLTLLSPEGDQGYPGEVHLKVTYTLDDANRLAITYHASTTSATPLNLTNHAYFNLGGASCANILNHSICIDADYFTAVDEELIPIANVPVAGTPFDFREPGIIADSIFMEDIQLACAGGFDHNWVLKDAGQLSKKLTLSEPNSGRVMSVWTDMPGVQFYSGNVIDETIPGRWGSPYNRFGGLCLETQFPPDAVNRPDFPSPVLRAGQKYDHQTVFEFGIAAS